MLHAETAAPERDQYGRFVLLTLPIDLTPRDLDTWPETRALIDMGLEAGALADASHSVIDASNVAPYRIQTEYGGRLWMMSADMQVDRDSLRDLDAFDMRQEQIPVSWGVEPNALNGATITMAGTPADIHDGDWAQINGQRFGSGDLRRWAQVAAVDPLRRTITISAMADAGFLRGPDAHRVIFDEAPPRFRAKPSRVPERLQKRRLDGRRA